MVLHRGILSVLLVAFTVCLVWWAGSALGQVAPDSVQRVFLPAVADDPRDVATVKATSPKPTPVVDITPTHTPTTIASATLTRPAPTQSPTASATATISAPDPTATRAPTAIPSATPTTIPTETPTLSPTPTATYTPTDSIAPTSTATVTATPTSVASPTTGMTATPTVTATAPPTATATALPALLPGRIAAAGETSCSLTATGGVRCWGYAADGQVGDGTLGESANNPIRPLPVEVVVEGAPIQGAVAVTAGQDHACAVLDSGLLLCWGSNDFGQLGVDGGAECTSKPCFSSAMTVTVGALPLTGVVAADAGYAHTCAVTESGAVLCWGQNHVGQLGDGTTTDRSIPGVVSGLDGGVVDLAVAKGAVNSHSCAALEDGTARCWGANAVWGQLGGGDTQATLEPITVTLDSAPMTGVTAVAVGANDWQGSHSCALRDDGTVYCWGSAMAGQVGNGTLGDSGVQLTPVKVTGLTGARRIVSGQLHTCAIAGVGLFCWGAAGDGQLGDGTMGDANFMRPAPVAVLGLQGAVVDVATGYAHTCAVTAGDVRQCWGNNFSGQLGDGNPGVASLVPVDVVWPAPSPP